jgi:hypothetical protein
LNLTLELNLKHLELLNHLKLNHLKLNLLIPPAELNLLS